MHTLRLLKQKTAPIIIDTVISDWVLTAKMVLFALKAGVQTTKVLH